MDQILLKLKRTKKRFATSLSYIYVVDNNVVNLFEFTNNESILLSQYDCMDPIIMIAATLQHVLITTSTKSILLSFLCQFIQTFPKLSLLKSINNQLFACQHHSIVHVSTNMTILYQSSESILDFQLSSPFLFLLTVDALNQINLILNHSEPLIKYSIFDKITSISLESSATLTFVKNNKNHFHSITSPIFNLLLKGYMDEAILYVNKSFKLPCAINFSDLIILIKALLNITMVNDALHFLNYFDEYYLFLINHPLATDLIQKYCDIKRFSINLQIAQQLQLLFTNVDITYKDVQLQQINHLLLTTNATNLVFDKISPILMEILLPLLNNNFVKYQCSLYLNNPNISIPLALQLGLTSEGLELAKLFVLSAATLNLIFKDQIDHSLLTDYMQIIHKNPSIIPNLKYPLNHCYSVFIRDFRFDPIIPSINVNDMISAMKYHRWDTLEYGKHENIQHYILTMCVLYDHKNLKELPEYYKALAKCKSNLFEIPSYINTYGDILTIMRIYDDKMTTQAMNIFLRCVLKLEYGSCIKEIIAYIKKHIEHVDGLLFLELVPNWGIHHLAEILEMLLRNKYSIKSELLETQRYRKKLERNSYYKSYKFEQ